MGLAELFSTTLFSTHSLEQLNYVSVMTRKTIFGQANLGFVYNMPELPTFHSPLALMVAGTYLKIAFFLFRLKRSKNMVRE